MVFRITPGGTLTELYSFCSQTTARMVLTLAMGWCKGPMEISTGQPLEAEPMRALIAHKEDAAGFQNYSGGHADHAAQL
jgi:hypothetical protein